MSKLFLFGGGPRPMSAIRRFVRAAGAPGPSRILVVTWSSEEPEAAFASLARDLAAAGAHRIDASLTPPEPSAGTCGGGFLLRGRGAEGRRRFLAQLDRATGVFFSGGDQTRVLDAVAHPPLRAAIRARFRSGIPFGGTSAGTAIMSSVSITGDRDPANPLGGTPVRAGLGLLTGAIADQHFILRGRHPRLAAAVAAHPHLLGVGVDEGAALEVTDGRQAHAIGGAVVIARFVSLGRTTLSLGASGRRIALASSSIELETLPAGARFDLRTLAAEPSAGRCGGGFLLRG